MVSVDSQRENSEPQPLIYILQRLDELEALLSRNSNNMADNQTGYNKITTSSIFTPIYSYYEYIGSQNIHFSLEMIKEGIQEKLNITILNLDLSEEMNRIYFVIRASTQIDRYKLFSLIMNIIMDNGFKLVSLIND